MKTTIEIDRRQRVVAALMLAAVDLPQPATEWAELMIEASKVCPGLTVDEIPMQGQRNRRLCLKRAETLIAEMLEEIEVVTT